MLMTVYLLKHMQAYTHILQKTGILKTFTVAKIVKKKDIDDLKALIKSIASDESEYKEMLAEEIAKMSNLHDDKNPIPGIIYRAPENDIKKLLIAITTKFCKGIKSQKFSKRDLAFLISAIINELDLTQEDFVKLKEELENQIDDDDDDDDDDDEYED